MPRGGGASSTPRDYHDCPGIPDRPPQCAARARRVMTSRIGATAVMEGLMKGKRGLIMGIANDHSIAWGMAKTLHDHGAELAFTFQGEALGKRVKPLAESIGSKIVLPCDVEDVASVDGVF